MGQLLESVLGKAAAIEGFEGEGTPFQSGEPPAIGVANMLESRGYHGLGNETLYHGVTGEKLQCTVFIGPVHYQRLRHMVCDKVHARSRGPMQLISRQPVEGRSRDGGLRFGEMERDCVVAHGASGVLLDRLFKESDAFDCAICDSCGLIAEEPAADYPSYGKNTTSFCRGCNLSGPEHISKVSMPFAFKLFMQELSGLCISIRLRTERALERIAAATRA